MDDLRFHFSRKYHDTVDVSEHDVAWTDCDISNVQRRPEVNNPSSPALVLGVTAVAEDREIP